MRKVGTYGFDEENTYYMNETNEKVFYLDEEGKEIVNNEELKFWALILNSPWSQNHEGYKIKVNCKDAYTEMEPESPTWVCEYYITGFDGIEANIFGYGNTEEDALKNCKDLFKYVQETFNKDNENI